MEEKDITQVGELLKKYLGRFDMAQDFSHEDLDHWFIHKDGRGGAEQVVWTYVVERDGKVTDFFSFYRLESTIIRANSNQHKVIKAAYLYYYATDVAFQDDAGKLKTRLNELMNDNLILAKQVSTHYRQIVSKSSILTQMQNGFDVVNGLTLLDNPLFLEDQKFGPGDGHLHYYLFNYRASPIAGGVNARDNIDVKSMGGVGMVML
jgi:glycylpeptide N-tetradecanoyltransferase